MSCGKMTLLLLVLWLSVSGTNCVRKDGVYGDGVSSPTAGGCQNCSICPYPCRPQSPPPPSGYPLPGAPPPPSANCPPTSPGCCQYSPPSPASPYTYVPYNNYSASPPTLLSKKPTLSIFLINVFFFGFVSHYLV